MEKEDIIVVEDMSASQVEPHDKMRSRDVNKVARGEQAPRPAHEFGSINQAPPKPPSTPSTNKKKHVDHHDDQDHHHHQVDHQSHQPS